MFDATAHYQSLYRSTEGKYGFQAQTVDEFIAWQQAFRSQLREILGLGRMAQDRGDHQPVAEQLESETLDGYTRQRWQIWVEPTVPLPFYLLIPEGASYATPLVICPHGHNHPRLYVGLYESEEERLHIINGDRDIAVQAVKQGYIALAPTTRGFGETRTAEDKTSGNLSSCRTELMHDLLVGRTPTGVRVWDMSTLLDWALANLSIDSRRIAITGNSGGGTIALFTAACDTRFTVAVPGCYFNTFTGSIGSIRHCDCNYVPGILRLGEMYDVAGLIAPRPFCAIAGKDDAIFPIEEAQYAFKQLQRIYAVADASEDCELYVGDGGHRYYSAGAWPFVAKHFATMAV